MGKKTIQLLRKKPGIKEELLRECVAIADLDPEGSAAVSSGVSLSASVEIDNLPSSQWGKVEVHCGVSLSCSPDQLQEARNLTDSMALGDAVKAGYIAAHVWGSEMEVMRELLHGREIEDGN